ncbi:MFS transporter [Aspergillus saccharolyticus JOP 1030-1]|uniref:MFS general substrate transporter n=1 Tax=Aspergillus saccharolyticus JOP 1030-1 TaxID=1450539 RepID=A0A318Z7T4_9EURO|nr:MFS general substrate transporter [Aspergillus saccharolyticus JOP 1030-1]PYH43371.1 MFS general substrate transporter [Aspergillus saccharolyticus JOP 1030-1]
MKEHEKLGFPLSNRRGIYESEVEVTSRSTGEQYPVTDLSKGIVGWESQDDPSNPRNFPARRKWFLLVLISMITLISPFASSVFASAAVLAREELGNTSSILETFTVTGYLFGYMAGPLLFSPLSELFGRTIILNIGTTCFVLFQVGCALAPSIRALIGFRLLTGIGGSACLATGGGVVSDLFVAEERGLAMSIYQAGPLLGPVLGPICGGFIAERAGWRWVFWVLVIGGGTLTSLVMVFNRETNPTVLIRRKTAHLQKALGKADLRSCFDTQGDKLQLPLTRRLSMPLQLLFRSPIVSMIAIYIAIVYGCMYLLFTTVTEVFQSTYHWRLDISGLSNLGIGAGFIAGQLAFGLLSDRMIARQKRRNNGEYEPEMRLSLSIYFAICLPASFFWYGWSVEAKTHWIVPIVGLFPFGFGMVGIFGTLQTYIIDSYPRYAASGTAAVTVTRSLLGALLPLAGSPMYAALGYGWGNSLLGFITLALLPLPIVFGRVGKGLRQRFAVAL